MRLTKAQAKVVGMMEQGWKLRDIAMSSFRMKVFLKKEKESVRISRETLEALLRKKLVVKTNSSTWWKKKCRLDNLEK